MAKKLNIGLVGCGFMGRAHSNAWRKVWNFFEVPFQPVLKAVCARREAEVRAFADRWGYESVETDWRRLVERPDIDAVDICAPNDVHKEIAIAAAEAGKMILCEKPLARNVPDALEMVEAVEKAGVPNTVWYNYRRVPAVTLAERLIAEGPAGQDLPLPVRVSTGLDDIGRPAPGRTVALAAGQSRGRERRDR